MFKTCVLNEIDITEVEKSLEYINNIKIEKSLYLIKFNSELFHFYYVGKELNNKIDILNYLIFAYDNFYLNTVGFSSFCDSSVFKDNYFNLNLYKFLNYNGLLVSKIFSISDILELKSVLLELK